MNQIVLRTNKGEYFPGEEICGAVYLKISRPTAGRGVQLKFHGYERFSYPSKPPENSHFDPSMAVFSEHRDHIQINIKLYETKGSLSIGNTGIPFKIRLPQTIPGTFHGEGVLDSLPWEATVEYILEAQVIDANELMAKQLLIILQNLPDGILQSDTLKAIDRAHPVRFFFFFKKNMHVTTRLLQNIHRAGDTLYLRVIVTNDTRIAVTSLHVQLLRQIKLISKHGSQYKAQYVEDWVPVGNPQEMDMSNCPKGFDKFHIPLRNVDGTCIYPSVDGIHVKCLYRLHITVKLSNNDVIDNYDVPVPVIISEKNKEWLEWIMPEWISHDTLDIIETDSTFSVPRNVLQTEPFSTVPGMQKL